MATRKKANISEEIVDSTVETVEEVTTPVTEIPEEKEAVSEQSVVETVSKPKSKEPKFKTGDIVFISKDADADLNGFKLFPPYKKYTYTVEAYDQNTGVYSLRRLNLSLKLKEELILAPSERAHDSLNRKQF